MSTNPSLAPGFFRVHTAAPASVAEPGNRYLAWYQCIVLSMAVIAIYANLPIYGYVQNPALLPKYTFLLTVLLIAPLVLAHQAAFAEYLMSPFVLWAGTLVAVNLIHLAAWTTDSDLGGVFLVDNVATARAALISTRIQYIVFAMLLGFAVATTPRKSYLYAAVVLMVLLPCAVLLDFISPGLFYAIDTDGAVLGRAAATFINPTMAGEALLHVFLLGCAVTAKKYRGPLFLLAGAAILATFSRASIIAWVLILLILVVRRTLPRFMLVAMVVAIALCVLFLGDFQSYLHSRDGFEGASSNIMSRLDFFADYSFDDDSSEERASVARAGWEMFLQNPVFGAGAGATLFWSHRGGTHNQLMLFAAEYGVIGIGMWVWLLLILWRGKFFQERGLQVAMVFLFAFMSMFTHQMLDGSSYWLATFALVSCRFDRSKAAAGLQRRMPIRRRLARQRYRVVGSGDAERLQRINGQP
jgi:hypothetical protein